MAATDAAIKSRHYSITKVCKKRYHISETDT